MVFSTTNLFKGIACPVGENCALTNCIFSHELRPKKQQTAETKSTTTTQPAKPAISSSDEPPNKRRKVDARSAPSKADQIRSELSKVRQTSATVTSEWDSNSLQYSLSQSGKQLPSLTRPVSPPARNGKAASREAADNRTVNTKWDYIHAATPPTVLKKAEPVETLNPRLVANDPAGHAKRSLFLKHLHAELVRLNSKLRESENLEGKEALVLSPADLVKWALDEEEEMATTNSAVYSNVIKQRIMKYKKTGMEQWMEDVKKLAAETRAVASPSNLEPKVIDTGLALNEEHLVLPHLVADQSSLSKYGYIPTPPTEAQAAEAAAAVEMSQNWEHCDRCSRRFQVFPERNEQGLLTSNGPCIHHPSRKIFPMRTKGENAMGHIKEPYHPCCGGAVGSPGCTESVDHVFKTNSPARLAAVLPFITTPENPGPAKDKHGNKVNAVAFDCEMGYTVYGMELIRLTAVSWPSGEKLIDVLVRPLGIVIDLNSRFSGVWPEHFTNAVPYTQYKERATTPQYYLASGNTVPYWNSQHDQDTESAKPPFLYPAPTYPIKKPLEKKTTTEPRPASPSSLPIVDSPQAARELLCSYLTPSTPLIGHAIENDLNAVRLCHPSIIDTVLLYPHPKPLPMRHGLKTLASLHLGRQIQMGGDRGHDSMEDATATGDLVRLKVGQTWKALRGKGWKIEGGALVAPEGSNGVGTPVAGMKRKKRADGGESTDEEVGAKNGSRDSVG